MSVDRERWKQAQEWELALWKRAQTRTGWRRFAYPILRPLLSVFRPKHVTGDDWNEWWAKQFDEYGFLPGHLGDYIELGCGPYTNTRLILKDRTADRVVCSDPLAGEYVKFKGRWLSEAVAHGTVELDTHPIEETPFPAGTFDVVVLINVLDHVRDADACMRTAVGLLKPGGYLVFGQNLVNVEAMGQYEWFEEGHPIRATDEDVEEHLRGLSPVLSKTLPPNDPPIHQGVLVYAGRRPPT